MISLTDRLASFASDARLDPIPESAAGLTRSAFIDTIGVAYGALDSELAPIMHGYAAALPGMPQAHVFGAVAMTDAANAALINASLAHYLDFDDVSLPMVGHISTVLVPELLALGEVRHASGAELMRAFVVGCEVAFRIGEAMNPGHFAEGWHPTVTIGSVAAAAAAGRLIGLDKARMLHALAIGATQGGGLRINIGTLTKPVHAGFAARNGIVAALLAEGGLTASTSVLEGALGFAHLYRGEGGGSLEVVAESVSESAPALAEFGLLQKQYPCVAGSHRAIDAMIELRLLHRLDAERVTHIAVAVDNYASSYLLYPSPATVSQARFSMPFLMAVALLEGKVGTEQISLSRVRDQRVRALSEKVRMYVHEELVGKFLEFLEVTVTLDDGSMVTRRVHIPKGHPQHPLSPDELVAKFRSCASGRAYTEAALFALESLASWSDVSEHIESIWLPTAPGTTIPRA